jgi:hypothetical protein
MICNLFERTLGCHKSYQIGYANICLHSNLEIFVLLKKFLGEKLRLGVVELRREERAPQRQRGAARHRRRSLSCRRSRQEM